MFYYSQRVPFLLNAMCISQVISTFSTEKLLHWPNADGIVQAVCPYTKVCDVKAAKIGPYDSCCTECFCGDECVSGPKCCFHNNTKMNYETCLYLRTKSNNFYTFTVKDMSFVSYYVVTNTPNGGCYESRGSCDSKDTSALYPVYSPKTGKIYFDKNCATCHGIIEIEEPILYFLCDDVRYTQSINFDDELTRFLNGDETSACFLSFDFYSTAIVKRICSIYAVDSIDTFINITNEVHLKSHYNMSLSDLADACLSNLYSPTISSSKKVYPNPFCYLYGEGTHIKGPCYQTSDGFKFSAILNPNVKDILHLDTRRKTSNIDQACFKTSTSSEHKQHKACRPVTCPIGHILDRTRKCIFFGSRVFKDGRMSTFVNIILRNTMDNKIPGYILTNITIDFLESSLKLPNEWRLAFWGFSADTTRDLLQDRTNLIMILQMRPGDLPNALQSMRTFLTKEVVILNEIYKLSIYGKALPLRAVLPEDVLSNIQCSTAKNTKDIGHIKNNVPDCWKMIGYNKVYPGYSLTIEPLSKLYFCNLVQLHDAEYHLMANDTVLYNDIAGKYFHEKEFLVQKIDAREKVVKVCFDDSGLVRPVTSASFTHRGKFLFFPIPAILFIDCWLFSRIEIEIIQ